MALYQAIDRELISNNSGELQVCQFLNAFTLKRFFIISQVPSGSVRGNHAHKRCVQILCCLRGQIELTMDNGTLKETIQLTDKSAAILIPTGIWSHQVYKSEDTSLLVLCNEEYEESEYLRNYSDFIEWVKKND